MTDVALDLAKAHKFDRIAVRVLVTLTVFATLLLAYLPRALDGVPGR